MAERFSVVMKREHDRETVLTLRNPEQLLIYNDTGGTPSYVNPTNKVTSVNSIQQTVTIAGGGLVVVSNSSHIITLTVTESTHAPKHLHIVNENKSLECNSSKITFVTANEFEPDTLQIWKAGLALRSGSGLDFAEGSLYDSFAMTVAPTCAQTLLAAYLARLGVAT